MTMLTEEEAKTKWCPFVRHHNAMFEPCGNSMAGAAPNHARNAPPFFTCIGADCMAWRQGSKLVEHPTRGFCGLAGKAE